MSCARNEYFYISISCIFQSSVSRRMIRQLFTQARVWLMPFMTRSAFLRFKSIFLPFLCAQLLWLCVGLWALSKRRWPALNAVCTLTDDCKCCCSVNVLLSLSILCGDVVLASQQPAAPHKSRRLRTTHISFPANVIFLCNLQTWSQILFGTVVCCCKLSTSVCRLFSSLACVLQCVKQLKNIPVNVILVSF